MQRRSLAPSVLRHWLAPIALSLSVHGLLLWALRPDSGWSVPWPAATTGGVEALSVSLAAPPSAEQTAAESAAIPLQNLADPTAFTAAALQPYQPALDLLASAQLASNSVEQSAASMGALPSPAPERQEAVALSEPQFVSSDFARSPAELVLELEIDATGLVQQIHVLSGNIPPEERHSILRKVGAMKFRPAIENGLGVASSKTYRVEFTH
ncbi:hypothetical protein [Chitinibacter tainanensis]|uniref:hypothetical protein n=1 Tax=Chitinibacter tainanensis TaxID=230667 RepID=UPI0023522E97|nr:hypothetical protein [Chitinibacter tainanensis]